ncbi:MAG: hypothetical protein MUF10_13800 [Thermoanaerobaculaceae bacterium]|jgi:hypothetical protein|nr:hypothetical protein [Thermoanaerobaculaceae bacterium]
MTRNLIKGAAAVGMALMVASSVLAQHRGGGPGAGTLPRIDTSKAVTVQGEVVSFLAGYGQGMPELIVRESNGTESTFVLGPFHYLQAQGFTAQAGDRAEINGWACSTCEHAVAVAQVKNLTRNLTLVLRNADGTPVWIGAKGSGARRHLGAGTTGVGSGMAPGATGGQGVGNGPGTGMMRHGGRHLCDGNGPDLTEVATYTGMVKSFTGGSGEGYPTLVLTTSAGEVSIVLSPYRALLQAGYTPVAGAQIELKAAPVTVDGVEHWVALTVTDVASGLQIVLRDPETGLPIAMGRGLRR